MIAQLEGSLRALGTDHVDLYQAHSGPNEVVDHDGLWEALNQQVARGTVRHLGLSLSGDDLHQVRRAGQVGASVVQVGYNRLDRTAEQGVFQACLEQDLGGGGPGAAGQRLPQRQVPAGRLDHGQGDWRSGGDPVEVQRKLALVEELGRTEVPDGVAMASWAIAWCLQDPAVSCVVAGCKSVEQLESNVGAADLDLVRDDHPLAAVIP